jgi:hypothetical protein
VKKYCYCCNALATTREHVPPQCFFPKKKHLPVGSKNYRRELITVPSCERHNTERSHDDEYAAAVVVATVESELMSLIIERKWLRAFKRNNSALWKTISSKSTPVRLVSNRNGLLIPEETLFFHIDRDPGLFHSK